MIVVAILTGILPFFFNLWIHVDGTEVFANNEMLISIATVSCRLRVNRQKPAAY